jgi:hypothetical protein
MCRSEAAKKTVKIVKNNPSPVISGRPYLIYAGINIGSSYFLDMIYI